MSAPRPEPVDPSPWLALAREAGAADVERAIAADAPGPAELAALLSPAAAGYVEPIAARAQAITRSRFGRTISLYVPLYLSDYCSGGCAYCGFASDRPRPRRRLEPPEMEAECGALRRLGFEEVLLLTGERTAQADFEYLREAVARAARHFHLIAIETFPMSEDEYRALADAGCTGVTIYQETYDPDAYERLHRWGPKRDYAARLDAPARALAAGLRTAGLGVLLGLSEPISDAISLFMHAEWLRRRFWQSGITISFPRLCHEAGEFVPPHPVDETFLARMIFAFRICLPDVPLVMSTRESPRFRDGVAGVGINKMSVASRTTVGGYADGAADRSGQFDVNDPRDVEAFCSMLRGKQLEPVFKNWDSAFR